MTKRDDQLREYVAEGRVYGADGDKLTKTEREAIAAGIEALWMQHLVEDKNMDHHIVVLKRLLEGKR